MALRVLAVDVGTKNLAFCLSHGLDRAPEFWRVFDCGTKKSATIPMKRAAALEIMDTDIRALMENVDLVVIEQQPTQNTTTVCLQYTLQTWFEYEFKNVDTRIMSAHLKLADHHKYPKDTYAQRKKAAIKVTEDIFNEKGWDLAHFHSHEKMDDLADTYLMTWYVHTHDGATTAAPKKRKRRAAAESRRRGEKSPLAADSDP